MKSSVLGYGGALVLVAIALVILVDAFVGGGKRLEPRQPVAVATGRTPPAPTGTVARPTPRATAAPGTRGATQGARPGRPAPRRTFGVGGSEPCPAGTAGYVRMGDTLRVTVRFPGNGYVAAFVEVTGQESMTKSATNTGRPQVFEFTGVPASLTRRVGVTVITGAGLRTCDVPPRR